MALTRVFPSNRSKQVRRNAAGTKTGSGDDTHMLIGSSGKGTTEYLYRSLVRFGIDYSSMKRILKVEVALKTETSSTHFSLGSAPQSMVYCLSSAFVDGTAGENVWTAGDYQWPGGYGAAVTIKAPINPDTGKPQDEAWVFADITNLYKNITPTNVVFADGSHGLGKPNYGLLFRAPGDEKNDTYRMIYHSYDVSGTGNDPYLLVTYDPENRPPNVPVLTAPGTTNVTFDDSFEGDHSDSDLDPMAAREIVVYPAGGGTPAWTLPANLQTAGSDEVATGHFSVPLSLAVGVLKSQIAYEWVARTRDPAGVWGPYSARRALRIMSLAPTVVASGLTTVSAMQAAKFGGAYSDPENNPLAHFTIQMRTIAAHTDAAFDPPNDLVWDTGTAIPTATEISKKLVSRNYSGQALLPASYTYRIRVEDSTGVWSAWSYDDFTLTVPYNPAPGAVDLQTQVARNAPVRIALYKMGPKRGPGALIGHIDDPIELGVSGYLNGAGEMYFSLPALHPYCQTLDPMQVHYAVEQWYGDRYRVLFSGLITDFDATADDMVAYGTDYLGLLLTAVDERYDPAKAFAPPPAGSHYTNQTIDAVIREQLGYHKGLANSPVAFINIGALSALTERVTIDSTYTPALQFINGLVDSHKQGTGREARFYARPIASPGTTSLAVAAAAGATNIKVAAVTGFAVGDVFRLGDNDAHQITAVGTAGSGGTGITFTGGLSFAHPVSEPVIEIAYEWALVDPWGNDRPNITLEYGGLISDFRVVALGDFGTRVLAVGQKQGEVKVYRAVGLGGLDEAVWGRRAKTAFFQDIIDQNDLQRRANESASVLAKVGKRLAVAIEADAMAPLDGWDLGDSIVINIVRGVVDTSRYGSLGLWTIYGLEWRYHPDGHSDLTLTLLPKKSATPPNPDLIPSANPGLSKEWQVGYGKPTIYGNPPVPSHA